MSTGSVSAASQGGMGTLVGMEMGLLLIDLIVLGLFTGLSLEVTL